MGLRVVTALATFCVSVVLGQSQTPPIGGYSGSHTDIPRWCGKPYEPGSPNYNPGGQVEPPAPAPSQLLYVQVRPRYSIYDNSEETGTFIVDAPISNIRESSLDLGSGHDWPHQSNGSEKLHFSINVEGSNQALVTGDVAVNSTGSTYDFSFKGLAPQLEPYKISLSWSLPFYQQSYKSQPVVASTELYYLPAKNSGSTVKVDNLYGGFLVANNVTSYAFEPLLPFGFYSSCSGYLNYSLANVTAYKDLGFNAVNPVCAYTDGDLTFLFDWLDEANLWYQYDMRSSFLNLTSVEDQIPLLKDRSNLLSWYTADEPDGWQYALNGTKITYDLLKKEDPYHPTSLVLNCQDYYFEQYTSGTDVIMQDAYPIGIDPTYSRPFLTPCNDTYGDCGCDNCHGSVTDVSDRLDDFVRYQSLLGLPSKPLWSVLQAFDGEGYWARDPTSKETWVMMILSFNHMAKGLMSWLYPPVASLEVAHGQMATVATGKDVGGFLIGANPTAIEVKGGKMLDVAYWRLEDEGKAMVALANAGNYSGGYGGKTAIPLPFNVAEVSGQPWGNLSWSLSSDGKLSVGGLIGLDTSMVVLKT